MALRFRNASALARQNKKILVIDRSSSSIDCNDREIGADRLASKVRKWLDRNLVAPDRLVTIRVDGHGMSRRTYNAAVIALKSGEYDCLLVESLSRISRRSLLNYRLLKLAEELQVEVVSLEDQVEDNEN